MILTFFFKLSAARMHDYKLMEVFTEIEAKYVLRHISSQWLSIKKPLRILDQWENQDEYFWNTFQSKIILKLSIRNVHVKDRKPVISWKWQIHQFSEITGNTGNTGIWSGMPDTFITCITCKNYLYFLYFGWYRHFSHQLSY